MHLLSKSASILSRTSLLKSGGDSIYLLNSLFKGAAPAALLAGAEELRVRREADPEDLEALERARRNRAQPLEVIRENTLIGSNVEDHPHPQK